MTANDIFGAPLTPDPAIALPAYVMPANLLQPAPLHKLNYVVEIVGQRSIVASQVTPLLDKAWQDALGRPTIHVMAAIDTAWRGFAVDETAQSFDSVCLAWPYVAPSGTLSRQSAERLLASAETYAKQVGRRALPIPLPEDAERMAQMLVQARDNLDVGVTMLILPGESDNAIAERTIWIACSSLGLEFVSPGTFQWRASFPVDGSLTSRNDPSRQLVEVAPLEDADFFSLGGVQSGRTHSGISIGFSVPLSPDPAESVRAAFAIASTFESRYGCIALDDTDQRVDAARGEALLREVDQAARALISAGIRPGSPEAVALFTT